MNAALHAESFRQSEASEIVAVGFEHARRLVPPCECLGPFDRCAGAKDEPGLLGASFVQGPTGARECDGRGELHRKSLSSELLYGFEGLLV